MKDRQVGTASSFQLGIKNEAMMYSHQADLCQAMGEYDREIKLRHQAKKTNKLYWQLETKRKKSLMKLEEQLKNLQLTLF